PPFPYTTLFRASAELISEQSLFLVILLRARIQRHVPLTEERVVVSDQLALRQRDLLGLVEGRRGDLIGDVRTALAGGGHQGGRHRQGRGWFVEASVGVVLG